MYANVGIRRLEFFGNMFHVELICITQCFANLNYMILLCNKQTNMIVHYYLLTNSVVLTRNIKYKKINKKANISCEVVQNNAYNVE